MGIAEEPIGDDAFEAIEVGGLDRWHVRAAKLDQRTRGPKVGAVALDEAGQNLHPHCKYE